MFERFTRNAIQAIVLAQDECRRSGQALVGVEELLIGLLALGEGLACEVLNSRNITLAAVRSPHSHQFTGGASTAEVPFAAQAEQVLVQASLEAADLLNESTGTEHILLSLLKEDDVRRMVEQLGFGADDLRAGVWQALLTLRLGSCNEQKEQSLIHGQIGRLYTFLGRRQEAVAAYKTALSLPGGQIFSPYLKECLGVEA